MNESDQAVLENEFSSGEMSNGDNGDEGRLGDDDDEEETIERNDAIFQKSFPNTSRRDSEDDWDRVVDSDFSFERSVSFHSEHLDDDMEEIDIGDTNVS